MQTIATPRRAATHRPLLLMRRRSRPISSARDSFRAGGVVSTELGAESADAQSRRPQESHADDERHDRGQAADREAQLGPRGPGSGVQPPKGAPVEPVAGDEGEGGGRGNHVEVATSPQRLHDPRAVGARFAHRGFEEVDDEQDGARPEDAADHVHDAEQDQEDVHIGEEQSTAGSRAGPPRPISGGRRSGAFATGPAGATPVATGSRFGGSAGGPQPRRPRRRPRDRRRLSLQGEARLLHVARVAAHEDLERRPARPPTSRPRCRRRGRRRSA